MALSRELLKRLNLDEEPLHKRLKLAENAFHNIDIPIIRKEDLILGWLCNCKTHSTDQNVWLSLKSCLKATHFDVKVDVKKFLINVLVEKLQEDIESVHSDISECCELLISNNGMQQYFISNPKDLGVLVKSLLNYVFKLYKRTFNIDEHSKEGIDVTLINENNGSISITYNIIISVIENIIQMFKSTLANKDTLRNIFIQDILYPLCSIIDHKCTNSINRLGAVAHKCIQQLIFGRKHTQSETYLKDESKLVDLLFVLTENARTKDLQSNLTTFGFIFRAAIGVFKSNSIVLDLILRELVECAGMHKKQILNSLLKHLNYIALDFENKIRGITLFEYFQNAIDNILLSKSMNRVDYEILTQLCYLNPLIIERRIQDILRKVFAESPTNTNIQYTNLMIAILNATIHLRQEKKLISAILIAVKYSSNQNSNMKHNMFFPQEFKETFLKSLNNITVSQSVSMLRTLVYYLRNDCMEVLQSSNTNDTCINIAIMQATVDLLVTFLDGLCIFEYSRMLTSHQKFINTFDDLGNILSLLTDKILHLNHNKKIITILLSAIFSWNETHSALKYYVPNAIAQELRFPISQVQWQQLFQRITNFGEDSCKNSMNKLVLQRVKISQHTLNESSIKFNSLLGGLEFSWPSLLKLNTEIISFLTNKEMSKVTHLLVTDMTSSMDNFCEWTEVLHKDSLQENKKFIISLLSCVISRIAHLTIEGVTKLIHKHFVTASKILLEDESVENQKVNEILMCMKEELSKDKWIQIDSASLCKIKMHLEILLCIPLMFLNTCMRSITFIIIFALRRECGKSNEIISLCDIIFSDLLEMPGPDMFQYINPSLLIDQLPQNRNVQKAVVLSLRNNVSHMMLKTLIKSSIHSKKNLCFLLKCIERVKSKLSIDQKIIVREAEKKLCKTIIKTLPLKITETDDVKILSIILKISIINKHIDEKVKHIAELTLHNIFLDDTDKNELSKDGLCLALVVLHNRKIFKVTNEIVRGIWCSLLKHPCTDVLLPLLESTEPQEFHDFLEHLHDQMVKFLSNTKENDLNNVCIIWNAILKTNMSGNRNKLRLTAINKLIQTIQIVTIPNNLWSSLLKLLQNILATKHLYLSGNVIDMSICFGLKSLQETTILTCKDTLTLCNILLKMGTSLITDRLPMLLILYKRILKVVVHKSKAVVDKSEDHIFKCLALDAEKFTSSLIKLKKDMIRLCPYLIADLLELFSEVSIADFVKISIQNCIHSLISICDQHAIAFLFRTLPVSLQEIFKMQLDVFNKFYKFSGKI
ncbi:uncharacterized protein LOC128891051 [Hylaeus anthracinus]|uniref:uncharacterized protein LOC128891051 n=1 Tax=Hylaeus anthracinus TaxID=313031 RepID=UPI0023B9C4C4|nr:uncharacterized protein LOC128891051 [Hylaeus anthracinus]XP_054006192.1 uncharacterized protein LOC128891051 [Hylaeus anthracinus]XP_054006193.1 uncharacterized protein LOC128891051 [Hylaeus anthracinus]